MIIVTKLNRNGGQLSELDGTEWLYPCRRLLHPEPETAGRTPPHWKVWTAAPGIFKGNPSSPIEHIDLDWGVMYISCRPKRIGTGTVRYQHGAGESCRGRERRIKAYPSNGVGAALQ